MDQISPELLAHIVKTHILPMFESKQKKSLRQKHNRMKGFNPDDQSTMYGEFKLSEQLSQNINEIK